MVGGCAESRPADVGRFDAAIACAPAVLAMAADAGGNSCRDFDTTGTDRCDDLGTGWAYPLVVNAVATLGRQGVHLLCRRRCSSKGDEGDCHGRHDTQPATAAEHDDGSAQLHVQMADCEQGGAAAAVH